MNTITYTMYDADYFIITYAIDISNLYQLLYKSVGDFTNKQQTYKCCEGLQSIDYYG